MKNLVTLLFIVLCCALCRAQDPNTTIEQNSTLPQVVQTIETLPWSEVTTNDFEHHGEGFLIDHLRNHPMLGNELEKLHEWLHQKVERLRPNGAKSFIVVEATDAEFLGWSNRGVIENAGWRIVHVPAKVAAKVRSVVALDKLHFAKQGFVTDADLQKYNTQFRNRQFQPVKNAKARFVSRITMFTRSGCRFCDEWRNEEAPKAKADGVSILEASDSTNSVPWFEVTDSAGTVTRYYGKTSYEAMKRGVQ